MKSEAKKTFRLGVPADTVTISEPTARTASRVRDTILVRLWLFMASLGMAGGPGEQAGPRRGDMVASPRAGRNQERARPNKKEAGVSPLVRKESRRLDDLSLRGS